MPPAKPPSATLRITIAQGAFLPVPPRLGGAVEKAWYELGRAFADAGHQVTHVGRHFEGLPARNRDQGVDYVRVRGHPTPRSLWRLKALDLLYSLRVRRILPPADILVTHTFWLPWLERRASRGRPVVHVARYPRGQLRAYPRRVVLQTVSTAIREAILAEVPDAGDRTPVVPYPVSARYLLPDQPSPERTVLYVGRVHPEKGLHLLIDAFGRATAAGLSGWTLRIVGPWETAQGGGGTDYHASLTSAAARAGGRIEFAGPVFDEDALVEHYRRAAFFVYPSLAERGETFGLAVLEAMAAGCAPLVSDLACFRDFVRPRETGLVFDHRAADPAAALAASLTALATDERLLRNLRRAAGETARQFTVDRVADRFLDLFRDLTSPGGQG